MEQMTGKERILSNRKTRSIINIVLTNGNMTTPIVINKKRFLMQNTCPFD